MQISANETMKMNSPKLTVINEADNSDTKLPADRNLIKAAAASSLPSQKGFPVYSVV